MGNSWGNIPTTTYRLWRYPDIMPDPEEEPTNDPCMGFETRLERSVQAPVDALYSAKMELRHRDYCVDPLLVFMACRRDYWPFPVFCSHEKHAYLTCRYEDFVIRSKEYERERRLIERGLITKQPKE